MHWLKTLGGVGIDDENGALYAPSVRRQLLGLLALIAGHDASGISRDKLLAYVWPDCDARRARNSLKQALYSARCSLGSSLIRCSSGMVRLNRGVICADLWQFEAALESGEEATAVRLYRGPFLDGFYVTGREDFERWIDLERERLARRYAEALRVLAQQADAAGKTLQAIIWWRRLTVVEPLCSRAALGLMRALVIAGDPTGAREHARVHAAYVRTELGGPAAPEVVAYANQLRVVSPPEATSPSGSPVAVPRVMIRRGPERRISGPANVIVHGSALW